MNGVKTRKQTAKEVKGEPSSKGLNGSANGHLSRDLTASSRAKSTENIFLFYPNIIGSSLPVRLPIFNAYLFGSGYSRIILAIASLYYMPLHPRTCSLLYSVSCLLDALDGVAARYFQQATKFGAVLDMVTDRCTTACLLVFLASAFPTWSILFQGLISLDLASHYMHMYATLSMGGSGQSHKKVDQKRTGKLLYLYYNNKVRSCNTYLRPFMVVAGQVADSAIHRTSSSPSAPSMNFSSSRFTFSPSPPQSSRLPSSPATIARLRQRNRVPQCSPQPRSWRGLAAPGLWSSLVRTKWIVLFPGSLQLYRARSWHSSST